MTCPRPALTRFLTVSLALTAITSAGWLVIDNLIDAGTFPARSRYLLAGSGAAASLLVTLLGTLIIRRSLREAENTEVKFQSLLDATPDAMVIIDRNGSVTLVNRQTEAMFGYSRRELLGKTFEDLIHQQSPEERAGASSSTWTTVTQRVEVTPMFVGRCKDGAELTLEINFSPLETKDGVLLISTMRNVTERRRREFHRGARQAVRRILADAVTLEKAAPALLQGVCAGLGWDLGALWVTEAGTGSPRRTGLWHRPGVTPADPATSAPTLASGSGLVHNVLKGGPPAWLPVFSGAGAKSSRYLTLAFPIAPGEKVLGALEFWSPETVEPDEELIETLNNVANQVGHYLQRKTAEQAVYESEARKRAILEAALDAIITIDRGGRVIEFNPAAEEIFGRRRGAAMGKEMAGMILPTGAGQRFRLSLAEYLATGDSATLAGRLEMSGLRADGREFPLELTLTPIIMDGPPLFTAYIRDISDRKRTEEALRDTEERFRQAQKMEAIGRLAGGVAHDFNNLMTVINGCTEILREDFPQSPEAGELLEEVHSAGTRAAKLTGQLLAFSRRQVLAPKVLDLNGIVTDLNKMLHRLIGEDIQLSTAQGADLDRVKVDRGQIEQVLMNLVVNARDAMPHGGKLTLETANVDLDETYCRAYPELTPGPYVLLAVSDTGSGMTREVQARLFEPFFTTKEVGKGTGLGLATVYGIVKQSGGHVAVYSEPGHGTTFKIYLPRVEEPISEMLPSRSSHELPAGSATVLLVEDEDDVRALTRRLLQRAGYCVLEARNGAEALATWAKVKADIDLVVTDVVMPGMNGGEVARRMLADRPDLKLLFLSGYTDSAVVQHNLLEDGAAFLQKPYTPRALARKLHELLSASPVERGWLSEGGAETANQNVLASC